MEYRLTSQMDIAKPGAFCMSTERKRTRHMKSQRALIVRINIIEYFGWSKWSFCRVDPMKSMPREASIHSRDGHGDNSVSRQLSSDTSASVKSATRICTPFDNSLKKPWVKSFRGPLMDSWQFFIRILSTGSRASQMLGKFSSSLPLRLWMTSAVEVQYIIHKGNSYRYESFSKYAVQEYSDRSIIGLQFIFDASLSQYRRFAIETFQKNS